MTRTFPPQRRNLLGTALTALVLWLSGCADTPRQETGRTVPDVRQPAPPSQALSATLPASRHAGLFRQAERVLAHFDWMGASALLQSLPAAQLSGDDRAYLVYLEARIDYCRGRQQQARERLQQLGAADLHPGIRYRILNFRRHSAALSGSYLQAAMLGDLVLRSAPPGEQPALQRDIWRNLQRLDPAELQMALRDGADTQWRGWLELALISRRGLAETPLALSMWRTENPAHPAATQLPGGLGFLLEPGTTPRSVALLLPLSGPLAPAGKAVRDGYLASYYAAQGTRGAAHDLLLLDLDHYPSAAAAYDAAVGQGATLVVGPLAKQAVAEIGNRPARPVPVLALNRSDETLQADASALVQLSLAAEDEAVRLAELAFGRGARSALIIRPAGDWGDKVERALRERWSELGGRVASGVAYDSRDAYSSTVKSALGLPASEERARDVRAMLATSIEFTARRRQDLDAIFLLSSNGPEARSIKPLLAFHYAGTVPVYAISSIYSGIPDARDQDLNGINLVEIPWLLGASPELRVAIAAGGTGSDAYTRLNALGADAFLLQTRFHQLQAGPDALLRGNTGLLSMDHELRIRRELSPATFDGGVLRPQ